MAKRVKIDCATTAPEPSSVLQQIDVVKPSDSMEIEVKPSDSTEIEVKPSDSTEIEVKPPSDSTEIEVKPSSDTKEIEGIEVKPSDPQDPQDIDPSHPMYLHGDDAPPEPDDWWKADRRCLKPEEYPEYLKMLGKGECFNAPRSRVSCPGGIILVHIDERNRDILTSHSERALTEYNTEQNAAFRFSGLVRATRQSVSGTMFYITFKAKEDGGSDQTFRAKVYQKIRNLGTFVKYCEKV